MSVDPFVRRAVAMLGVLSVVAALYLVVPLSGFALTAYYQMLASSSILIALMGVAYHRPVRRRGWLLVLAGFRQLGGRRHGVFHRAALWHGEVYPAPSDALYLAGYVVMAAGAVVMVRTRRSGRDMTALLGALIIATGAAVVAAVFVIAPLASASDLTTVGKVIASSYPIGDVLLIAVIVRMWASPGAQTASYRLLVSAFVLTTAGDVFWNVELIATGDLALCPDVVKADRSLVHGCATQPGQSAVLRALVTYAEALGTLVCAEGVEDWADLDHLEELGVSLAQGYLLGRPDPEWRAGNALTGPAAELDVLGA